MSVSISHNGVITAVGKYTVTVAISPSTEDCDGCAISKLCSKSESVEVYYDKPDKSMIGKSVTIEISSASQSKAVALMLAIPIILLVATMLICVRCGLSELISALASIAVVAIWYAAIYLTTRNTFSKQSVKISRLQT